MKVLQLTAPREYSLLEMPTPIPQTGEALMRIDAVTTCPQWDLHLRHNEAMFPGHEFVFPYSPGQPGHEASGTIAALGDGVQGLKIGDRVSVWRDGGQDLPGCYAQFVTRPADHFIRVPAHLSPSQTAPLELAMCVAATFLVMNEMNVLRDKRIGISGLGPSGLIALQMAKAEGAREIVGFDLSEERRALALQLGADEAFDPREEGASTRAALDSAIDCVGARASVSFLMDAARDCVAIFGVVRDEIPFTMEHWGKGLRLCGYPGHSRAAAAYAVALMERGALDLAPLITHHLPLERYAEGVDLLESQQAIKVCFHPFEEA